jgi:hypothetical protein
MPGYSSPSKPAGLCPGGGTRVARMLADGREALRAVPAWQSEYHFAFDDDKCLFYWATTYTWFGAPKRPPIGGKGCNRGHSGARTGGFSK